VARLTLRHQTETSEEEVAITLFSFPVKSACFAPGYCLAQVGDASHSNCGYDVQVCPVQMSESLTLEVIHDAQASLAVQN